MNYWTTANIQRLSNEILTENYWDFSRSYEATKNTKSRERIYQNMSLIFKELLRRGYNG
jgi:hypothetical protein